MRAYSAKGLTTVQQSRLDADGSMERAIATLLRRGVLLAGVLVLLGGVVYLGRHGLELADYRVFHGIPSEMRTIPGVLGAAASGRGRALILLGLLVLIATPVARVGLGAIAFARQRDWLYVVVSLIVLAALFCSLAGRGLDGTGNGEAAPAGGASPSPEKSQGGATPSLNTGG